MVEFMHYCYNYCKINRVIAPIDGKKIAQSYLTMYFGEVAASLSDMEEVIGRKVKFTDVEPTTWLLRVTW
jgi:amidase